MVETVEEDQEDAALHLQQRLEQQRRQAERHRPRSAESPPPAEEDTTGLAQRLMSATLDNVFGSGTAASPTPPSSPASPDNSPFTAAGAPSASPPASPLQSLASSRQPRVSSVLPAAPRPRRLPRNLAGEPAAAADSFSWASASFQAAAARASHTYIGHGQWLPIVRGPAGRSCS
jgi:hypothetical protein